MSLELKLLVVPGKRISLKDRLDGITQEFEDQQIQVIEKVVRDSSNFIDFRHHAGKTQSR